ncbi:UDP-glucose 4-epimerase (Galactowaldenase) (UDP-galactose 4-epimerase) (plasmid) [Legionella adelaidensis]|uniref:UDP-glucose 4-epimerase n=1 Tax=Legionella adelaidensis TaxID=45056 RepID=A0A0W0R4R4_9GAMM|nr:NAD(P)-dependent oxidoreductase [Legionella adelaidensis]KTC66037.1 UDP-glucose 4-epimerase [Legionella adelaidensis]VEH85696.1 UDP-glucose 4-epimerase (Galactowaldenase) (UDP-galactose 4-epimerase) [Legionella adelaidensis]
MKIAITGASSFIGTHLLSSYRANEHEINVLSRKPLQVLPENVTSFRGDLLDSACLEGFVKDCDVVVNLVYLWDADCKQNLQAIENLAKVCAAAGVKRLVHCSSSSVYGGVKEVVIDEKTACLPITEYACTKMAIEELLMKKFSGELEIIILRPTQVFGPGGKNLLKLIHDLSHKTKFKNYLKSCLLSQRKMNLVYIENVIEALYFLMTKKDLQFNTYVISDDEDYSNEFKNVESLIKAELNIQESKIPHLFLPLFFYTAIYKIISKGNIHPRASFINLNLKQEGFKKPVHFKEGLKNFLNWYKYENIKCKSID